MTPRWRMAVPPWCEVRSWSRATEACSQFSRSAVSTPPTHRDAGATVASAPFRQHLRAWRDLSSGSDPRVQLASDAWHLKTPTKQIRARTK